MKRKTEVLSIKTTPEIKAALKQIAARENRSVANALEALVLDYFSRFRLPPPRGRDGYLEQ